MADVLILIPARMASHRLPGKPLADIAGEPMIVHVMRRAQAAQLGPVVIATDSEAIAACVEKAGGRAVMTRADHASGSDRIFEALAAADPERRAGIIVNVQGDLPTIAPADIAAVIVPLALFTVYRAWTGKLVAHRSIARITLPLWLFVSFSGVVVFVMLYYSPG